MTEIGNQNNLEAESEDNENLDMDEDMMLAGLSMFNSEIYNLKYGIGKLC